MDEQIKNIILDEFTKLVHTIEGDFHIAVQDFRIGIPGILIQWFGGYALLKAIAKL